MSSGECLSLHRDGRLEGPFAAADAGFLGSLESWWQALRLPDGTERETRLPFLGGWLLYLGYELAAEIEPCLHLPPSDEPVIALAIRTPAAWVRDRVARQSWLVSEVDGTPLLERFESHVRELGTMAHAPADSRAASRKASRSPPRSAAYDLVEDEPAGFVRAVERALEHIGAGDVYQVNLSRRWRCRAYAPVDAGAVYRRLRLRNPSPFSAFLRMGEFSLMCSSPERLVSVRGGIASTRPIAGTRARSPDSGADAAQAAALLANDKERAEHVMLIDLERNDLGRVCRGGSVQVDEYMTLESYPHVHHIVSNVRGRLRAEVSPVDVLRALFPGGTITGCPKVRCMQIIAEIEGAGRGAYTGSLGYLNRDGSCDLNILIRTLSACGDRLELRTGAGIVADSEPWAELAETRAKARGLLDALGGS